jgi:DNA-binding MarR family transcriptional regulator
MSQLRWLDDRELHLWRSWLRLNQELRGHLADLLNRETGLSEPDYAVLVPLSESSDGTLRARDLRREILWDRSRLSHHLGRMEKRGLIAREECVADARGAMVRLTDAGRAAIEGAAPGHVEATRRYFFDLLSEKEIDVLTRVFDRVLANLDADDAPPRPSSSDAPRREPVTEDIDQDAGDVGLDLRAPSGPAVPVTDDP